ncbi:Zinc finger MYND domain-containing protein 15, partial [Perkinsus olseni]
SPNVIPTFTDGPGIPTLCFRAIRKITSGEEICHSYVELTLPSWKRRDVLLRDYEFLCQCERCGALNVDGQPRVGSEDWRMVQGGAKVNRLVLTDPDLCGTADICDDDDDDTQPSSVVIGCFMMQVLSMEYTSNSHQQPYEGH